MVTLLEAGNIEGNDPLRIYYYAARIEDMSLQWGGFGPIAQAQRIGGTLPQTPDAQVPDFVLDVDVNQMLRNQRMANAIDWINELVILREDTNAYYDGALASGVSEHQKATVRQVQRQFSNALGHEFAKLYEFQGDRYGAEEARRSLTQPFSSLPVVEEYEFSS